MGVRGSISIPSAPLKVPITIGTFLFFLLFLSEMIADEIRQKLQDIVRGASLKGATDRCSAIRNLLVESFGSNPTIKSEFESRTILKEKQANFLKEYAIKTNCWLNNLPIGSEYLTRGGESKIYLSPDKLDVLKVNDAVYYATWSEYLNSIVLHNILFPNTTYSFLGFTMQDGSLCIVLRQPFIAGVQADLEDIKDFLAFNGFLNTKRQDYFNEEFGLKLEDMHDENVIADNDLLFFIDTVFYIIEKE